MPFIMIDSVTFGDVAHVGESRGHSRREYYVDSRVCDLMNAWRFNREPRQFVAGLLADAMDECECEKDTAYLALVGWMRKVFGGMKTLGAGCEWHDAFFHAHKAAELV